MRACRTNQKAAFLDGDQPAYAADARRRSMASRRRARSGSGAHTFVAPTHKQDGRRRRRKPRSAWCVTRPSGPEWLEIAGCILLSSSQGYHQKLCVPCGEARRASGRLLQVCVPCSACSPLRSVLPAPDMGFRCVFVVRGVAVACGRIGRLVLALSYWLPFCHSCHLSCHRSQMPVSAVLVGNRICAAIREEVRAEYLLLVNSGTKKAGATDKEYHTYLR
ncbi:hypothetical protein LX36DRAFT_21890 [Colletotrichum falcatum]|nr:hypothetical protein LX36DRAFT_21890 [Colletotrichum falcatum]